MRNAVFLSPVQIESVCAAAIACSVKPYGKPETGETLPTCPEAEKVTRSRTVP